MSAIPSHQISQSGMRWLEKRGEEHLLRLLVYYCWATMLQCQFVSANLKLLIK
jgi:hypothetical protein